MVRKPIRWSHGMWTPENRRLHDRSKLRYPGLSDMAMNQGSS